MRPRPLAALLLPAVLALAPPASAEDAAGYASVEALAADLDAAFALIPYSTSALTALLGDYFACSALRADDESLCAAIDRRARAAEYKGLPPCASLFHTGRVLRWYMKPDSDPEPCLGWVRLFSPDWDEARMRNECAVDPPYFQRADLDGYCGTHTDPAEHARCFVEQAYVARDPARCPTEAQARAADAEGTETCALQARLLKALAENDPSLVAGSPFAALVTRSADPCRPLAGRALAAYREALRARSREAARAAEDGAPKKAAPLPEHAELERRARAGEATTELIGYFACEALRRGDGSLCARVDGNLLPAAAHRPPPCLRLYRTARGIRWVMRPDHDPAPCVELERLDSGVDPEEERRACADELPYAHRADPDGVCVLLRDEYPGPAGPRRCWMEHAQLLRDPARCPSLEEAAALGATGVESCPLQARLYKALAEDDPAPVAGTPFAPMLGGAPDACRPLAVKALSAAGSGGKAQ